MYAKLQKCKFWLDKVNFLDHVISKDNILVDLMKIEAIMNWPRPTKITKMRSFFEMAGYYKMFVEGFSKVALLIIRFI